MVINVKIKWNFLPIDKKFQKETFDCGYAVLNNYLKKYARQNHNKGIAKAFVALDASGSLKIDGYYTVNASVIEYESIPESMKRGIPAYPVPAMLIGKLAVDNLVKGQGLGRRLLADALLRAVRASQEIAIYAL